MVAFNPSAADFTCDILKKLNSGETCEDFYITTVSLTFEIPWNVLIVYVDGKLQGITTWLFFTPVRFPKAFNSVNTSPIWKTKRTLLYYRLWIQFSSRKSMFAVCHNGTLNFFTFDLHGPNFNLWPLSPTNITNLKNFVPQVRLRYFCRKTHRSLPWSRPRVLREYICIPHFRAISHAILNGVPREGKSRPHLQSAVLSFSLFNFLQLPLDFENW